MRRKKKNNFIKILVFLLLCIGIGYAALMTDLSINGVANVTHSSWDIHFDNLVVNQESNAMVDQAANIDTNTSISYEVTLTKPGDFYEFNVDVVNEGTIDAMIESVSSKLNNVEITTLPNHLEYSVTYEDDIAIAPNQLLEAGNSETYKVRIGYKKDINPEDLPSTDETLNLLFTVTYVQADENAIPKPQQPVIMPVSGSNDKTTFRSDTYRRNIKIINLDNEINPPANVIESWDIGVAQNGNVMAYITQNANDNTKYDLYIQGDGVLYANPNSSNLFYDLRGLDSINNIDVLNTSMVTNMYAMFWNTGYNSTIFTLNLGDKFDTSNVENMSYMFANAGYSSSVFTLDLGNKFDTSNVTNMYAMFSLLGYNSTLLTLDLGNKFDTSKVTNMSHMFDNTGSSSTVFTLNLGDKFDTSQVTNMSSMFGGLGYNSTVLTLDLGDKFDTSQVTDMENMFKNIGRSSTIFTLDLGNKFDTSQVTDMSQMFENAGYNNSTFQLDLSSFDFANVTDMSNMFFGFKSTQKIYVKNAADQSWVISHGGSNLTTANVLIKN